KPLLPQELIDTLSRFLPNAFLGKGASSDPEPRTPAPRRATGVRDPGTPFTADSFDEDSLGALLDQVFPTSDSGTLSRSIRRRAKADAGPESQIGAREGLEPPEDAKVPPPAPSPPMSETSDFDRALATP